MYCIQIPKGQKTEVDAEKKYKKFPDFRFDSRLQASYWNRMLNYVEGQIAPALGQKIFDKCLSVGIEFTIKSPPIARTLTLRD
jgi:hypothetical protein